MCVYMCFFVLICIHACVSLYLVCVYMYVCPCLHIFVHVFMSIACVHAYVFVYLCVCLGWGGQTESISFVDFPAFFQAITEQWKNKMLLWTGKTRAAQSAVTHRPHQLSTAYLPCDTEPLVCFLMGRVQAVLAGWRTHVLHRHHVRSYVLSGAIAVPLLCVKLFSDWCYGLLGKRPMAGPVTQGPVAGEVIRPWWGSQC